MSARTFAHWQAAYAEHGIPLLPMEITATRKKPMVTRPDRFNLNASKSLTTRPRYKDVEVFGFMAGPRSRVTVVDIDAANDRLLQDVQDRHGPSPFIARTGSGGFHVYYRNNGEQAKVGRVRPWRETGEPIDVLHSGPVVAPPSQGRQAPYEIIHGTLEDLARLTVMQGLGVPAGGGSATTARIGQGSRNKALLAHCGHHVRHCDNLDALIDVARTYAEQELDRFDGHPFTDAEVVKAAHSVWEWEEKGTNRFGRPGVWFDAAEAMHLLTTDSDLFCLLSFAKANNKPDAEFWLANGLADASNARSPFRRWSRTRLAATRKRGEAQGYFECIRKARSGQVALYRWGQNKESSGCQIFDTYPQSIPLPSFPQASISSSEANPSSPPSAPERSSAASPEPRRGKAA